jgi:hypothetical protein
MSDYKRDPNMDPQKRAGNDGISFTKNGNNQRNGTTIATDGRPVWTRDKATHTSW